MRTFIGPDIILSDLTEGPTLFAQSVLVAMCSPKIGDVKSTNENEGF